MLNLMEHCPKEAAHLRKDLLIAARHIFATDLRQSLYYFFYSVPTELFKWLNKFFKTEANQ